MLQYPWYTTGIDGLVLAVLGCTRMEQRWLVLIIRVYLQPVSIMTHIFKPHPIVAVNAPP